MSVKLWYAPTDSLPGGFCATHESYDTALAQAANDVEQGHDPLPDRIVGEDGSILADSNAIRSAAG